MKVISSKKSGLSGALATSDIDSSGVLDIDGVGNVTIDSEASITMGATLTDGQTLKLGKNGATELIFTPHGTPANEKISLTNTVGTDAAAIKLATVAAGGITLDSGGGITLDADSGTIQFADGGVSLGTITSAGYSGTAGTASVATAVTVSDNESTAENNLLTFVAGAATATGNHGLEMDGDLKYNPSTGHLSAPIFEGTKNILAHVIHTPTTKLEQTLTTSYAVVGNGYLKTTFTTPVGITEVIVEAHVYVLTITNARHIYLGLSGDDNSTTYSEFYSEYSISDQGTTEAFITYSDVKYRTGHTRKWHLKGLSASTTYHINLGSKSSATTAYLNMGGDVGKGALMVYHKMSSHNYDGEGPGS
jgi:hypothetical protein